MVDAETKAGKFECSIFNLAGYYQNSSPDALHQLFTSFNRGPALLASTVLPVGATHLAQWPQHLHHT